MEAFIIGEDMERRQNPGLPLDTTAAPSATIGQSLPTILFSGATGTNIEIAAPTVITSTTTTPSSTDVVLATSTSGPAPAATTSAAAAAASTSNEQTILIAVLVPVCVLLALIPTVAYLCYLRRRDRKNREILRGRLAPSGASAHTADALLMRRSMSASSHRDAKHPSVSSEDLDLVALEKGRRQPEIRDSASIFAPPQHGLGRKGAPGSIDLQRKPGVPVPPVATQSPTLPPLNFDKDDEKDSFTNPSSASPPRPNVPSSLPTFAPTQHKRAPNPALAPAPANTRSNTASPSPNPAAMSPAIASSKASPHTSNMDNPNWPLPAPSIRDSASTYSSVGGAAAAPAMNKPLPSNLSRELSPGGNPTPRNQATRAAQPGPRESSIAYGMPPMPPSPQSEPHGAGDRRSGANKKRDSDAISEMSYSTSVRGKRDTRRDTDAVSIISAMSDKDR